MEPGHDVPRSDLRNRSIGSTLSGPSRPRQGAQERLVPDRKGCIPDAPEGGHSTHAGTLLEGAVAALPEDPPDAAREEDVVPMLPGPPDWLPAAPPEIPLLDAAPPADPAVGPLVVGVGVAPPGVAAVCASVGNAAVTESSAA